MNIEVESVKGNGGRAIVRLADGSSIEADLLVVGSAWHRTPPWPSRRPADGQRHPRRRPAAHLRPDVFAAGDVANAYHPLLGRRLRVEHWDNAIEQGLVAAQNMLGKAVSYDRLPYFFSDQYDFGMEYVGNVGPDGYDQMVLRGKPDDGHLHRVLAQGGRVLAGMHVNDWDAMDPIRTDCRPPASRAAAWMTSPCH